jgi:hypothetical protein
MSVTRALILIATLGLASSVHAEPNPQPWKQGVTAAQMKDAQRLLDEGNALALEHEFTAALAKYQQAVAIWDHPAIRFNIVRCLIQLDRLVEASHDLELALRYGAAPLEDTVYNEALAYQKLLATQIATIEVSCPQAGVEITLDGQALATCPATKAPVVAPGRHQLVAKRTGFLTRTFDVVVLGGKTETVAVSLTENTGQVTHRWATWFPWTVFIGGFAVAGVGALFTFNAAGARDAYYAQLQRDCSAAPCPSGYAQNLRDRAVLEDRIGVASLAVGAAAVVTGAVLLYMNRGRSEYPGEEARTTAVVAPVPGGGVAAAVLGRF